MVILLTHGTAFAVDLSPIISFFGSGPAMEANTDETAWQAFKDRPNANTQNELFKLANTTGHYVAKNYAGCILANGLGTNKVSNKPAALNYFNAARQHNGLALYNYGLLTYISSNQTNGASLRAISDAYKAEGMEEAGVWLLMDGYKRKAIDPVIVEELVTIRSPVGFYYRAYQLYMAKNYQEALRYARMAAEIGEVNSMGLLSNIYKAMYDNSKGADASLLKESMIWLYAKQIMSDPDPSALIGKYPADMLDNQAWREAVLWTKNRDRRTLNYSETLCKLRLHVNRTK